ncbi:MAG: cupin domain-containing protein [Rickettsiales bacterium]|nr:cupin domain-containing protein [Pseudomonadota bacterium]MDA0966381.1 cupin domain-containing protein [Pseudomonadota bacterium]MDG4544014.1 cupin domain-containing protein [Rickettsiales bacterium]MDG4545508.1 cupin domain-containing protein [Rickettsiales bacterium]MDG4547957.1 cupin domain-containing protein [Rickettsiales bacterium]
MKDQEVKQSLNDDNYMLFPDEREGEKTNNADVALEEVTPLKSLIGNMNEADFFSDIWEKKYKTVNKSFDFAKLFDIGHLGQMLCVPRPEIKANITMGKMVDGEYHGVVVSLEDGSADMYEIYRLWAEGYSLIVPELHRRWEPIVEFTNKLSEQFGFKVEANLYYTPSNAVAFPAHYDTHDIFVVQISGEKKWYLYKSRTKLPLKSQRYDIEDINLKKDLAAKKSQVILKTGEVMYLPRGQVHSAESGSSPSMHLSIGIHSVRWLDILNEIVGHHAASSLFLRSAVSQECIKNGINKETITKITDIIADTPKNWQKILEELTYKT